jgi:hypothetical protein
MPPQRRKHDREESRQPGAGAGLFSRQRAVDEALLETTIRLFEKRTGRTLTKEDARQIVENLTGFFQVLAEWDRTERHGRAALVQSKSESEEAVLPTRRK